MRAPMPAAAWRETDSPPIPDLLALAASGLNSMFDPERQTFCDRLVLSEDGVSRRGISCRYTAMTLLGLGRYEKAGFPSPFLVRDLAVALVDDSDWVQNLGDVGLSLWTCAEIAPERLDRCLRPADAVLAFEGSVQTRMRCTMELAWFLTGIAKRVLAEPSERKHWETTAVAAFKLLKSNQGPAGFFGHRAAGFSPASWRGPIGSFADQVYPIYAFTMFARAFGRDDALEAAGACADAICGAQGPLGQWWWHYDCWSGRVMQRYPVYSVHQEGMAPMALRAVGQATGRSFADPINRGLRWIFGQNELNQDMTDLRHAVVWRSLRFSNRARLVQQELRGWSRSGTEALPVDGLSVLYECRPYELGWRLYALSPTGSARTAR